MSKSEKPDVKRDLETSRGMLHYTTCKLLEETKKRPVLWNKKDPNYKKRECLDKGWNDVTRTFVPFFDELDEDEQFTLSEVLRNRYHRCVGQLNTSIKNRNDPKYRPFLYAKQMDFYLKMRGYKLEDLYDEKEIEAIVKTEKPIENDKREGEKQKEDEDQIDEIEILLRRELGEDDEEGNDPINENAVSSSKKAKTVELSPATAARSPRLRQKQTILQTSSKEPKPTSTTSKNKEPIRKSLQIKKSHSPDDDFLGYDDDMSSQNNDEEEEDEEEEEEELVEYHEVEDKMDYIEEEHEMEEVPQQNDFRQQQKQQKPKPTKTKIYSISAALPITTANTITNTFQNESDAADQAFFESIKPAIRRMNDAQKLDFKIDVLQVLRSFQTN